MYEYPGSIWKICCVENMHCHKFDLSEHCIHVFEGVFLALCIVFSILLQNAQGYMNNMKLRIIRNFRSPKLGCATPTDHPEGIMFLQVRRNVFGFTA